MGTYQLREKTLAEKRRSSGLLWVSIGLTTHPRKIIMLNKKLEGLGPQKAVKLMMMISLMWFKYTY
jgi:hypothetical protein